MANAALETLLKAVASGSVSAEKAAQLISSQKGKSLSAADLVKVAGGGGIDSSGCGVCWD